MTVVVLASATPASASLLSTSGTLGTANLLGAPGTTAPTLSDALSSGPGNVAQLAACPIAQALPTGVPGVNQLSSVICALGSLNYAYATVYTRPDGTKVRRITRAVAGVPTLLDVNGDAVWDFTGTLSVALTLDRLTLTISRLPTTSASWPVSIKAIANNPAAQNGFVGVGYDGAQGTPERFSASVGLASLVNGDGRLDLEVTHTRAPASLSLRGELLRGNPDSPSHAHRGLIDFAPVPASLGARLKLQADHSAVDITSSVPSLVKPHVQIIAPGEEQYIDAVIDKLPTRVGLRYDKVGTTRTFAYSATSTITHAQVSYRDLAGSTAAADVIDMPTRATLTFTTGTDSALMTYAASSRATRAQIDVGTPARTLSATFTNLPTTISKLLHKSTALGGRVEFESDTGADRAELHTTTAKNDASLDVAVEGIPAKIDRLEYTMTSDQLEVDYVASASIPRATVALSERLPASAPDVTPPVPAHRRTVDATVVGLPAAVNFKLDKASRSVHLTNGARTPQIHIAATDELPFFARATNVELKLDDLSPGLDVTFGEDSVELGTRGSHIGAAELLAANRTDMRLAAADDGLLLRDIRDGAFVIFGRVRGLRHVLYQDTGDGTNLRFDAVAPNGTDLVIDARRDVVDPLWVHTFPDGSKREYRVPGTERIDVRLQDYPSGMSLGLENKTGEIHADYTAHRAAGNLTFERATAYRGTPIPMTYKHQFTADRMASSYAPSTWDKQMTLALTPMPASLQACYVPRGAACSDRTWTRSMFEDFDPDVDVSGGSLRLHAGTRTLFFVDERSTEPVPISYLRFKTAVDAAGDPCDKLVRIPVPGSDPVPACRYAERKPGVATKLIDLSLGTLMLQSHLERSGWVGSNIATIFAGDAANNKGYVAMDTQWQDPPLFTGASLCAALGSPARDCDQLADPPGPLAGSIGVQPPPAEAAIDGKIEKEGSMCVAGEDCDAISDAFESTLGGSPLPIGIAAKTDALDLHFGIPFGADHRVFEFDPDELIFAKHKSGAAYCGGGTSLNSKGSSFREEFCNISLPAP